MILLSRCVIITSFQSAPLKESIQFLKDDFIVCADRGYSHARAEGINPNAVIGDFDSIDFHEIEDDLDHAGLAGRCAVVRVAAEKDDTDTLICLKYGIDLGFDEFFVLGGLGGRLDHTVANLQTMSCAVDHQKTIWFLDGRNRATLRAPGKFTVKRPEPRNAAAHENEFISLFAYSDFCEGVTIMGVKYPLENYRMHHSFPIGVSNEFTGEEAEISHTAGKLLIILSCD